MRKSTIIVIAALGVGIAMQTSAAIYPPGHARTSPKWIDARTAPAGGRTAIVPVDWVRVPSEPSESESGSGVAHSQRHSMSAGGARVSIVEFEDFQCPYCARAESAIDQVREKYGDQVAIEYRDFPLPFHRNAMDAAVAARCAGAQGQLEQYRTALLDHQSDLSRPALEELAKNQGLDPREFDRCLDGDRYQRAIDADIAEGKRSRVEGTPAFLINGKLYSGALSFEQLQSIIDAHLAGR